MKLLISTFLLSITTLPSVPATFNGFNIHQTILDELASYGFGSNDIKRVQSASKSPYDFIIVGSGPGGSPVANRLSENPNWNVLLLEAGEPENLVVQVPGIASILQQTPYNWGYRSQPQTTACLGMKDRRCTCPRGKSLGGTSSINYMLYTRGNKLDYDEWANDGNTGWSYKDVLPYFKKGEKFRVSGNVNWTYHGSNGPLSVEHPPYRSPLATQFLKAGRDEGYKIVDYNGRQQIGFSYLQVTEDRGTRCSASKAYLRVNRPNLDIMTGARVTRILIDENKRAVGVEYMKNGKLHKVYVKKEIILSAGSIDSPKLLMLSGIGPRDHLEQFGIPVIKDAKVGYNLKEHLGFLGLNFKVNASVTYLVTRALLNPKTYLDFGLRRNGQLTLPGGAESVAFVRTKHAIDERPDLELLFIGTSLAADNKLSLARGYGVADHVYERVFRPMENQDHFTIWPVVQKPLSTGRIKLKSSNPFDSPIIESNFFTHPLDVEVILEGVKHAIRLVNSPHFQAYGSRINKIKIPGCENHEFGSDDYWRCAIRALPATMDHETGSCKMGPSSDPNAVVDPQLKVHGIKGLRVSDASIIPKIPSGHATGWVYMVGEKAADMIKKTWS